MIDLSDVAVTVDGDGALLCPRCGGKYLHHVGSITYSRNEDEKQVQRTVVQRGSITSRRVNSCCSGNPSSRRDGLTILFYCELCGPDLGPDDIRPTLELSIAQHKGMTYLAWRDLSDTVSQSETA